MRPRVSILCARAVLPIRDRIGSVPDGRSPVIAGRETVATVEAPGNMRLGGEAAPIREGADRHVEAGRVGSTSLSGRERGSSRNRPGCRRPPRLRQPVDPAGRSRPEPEPSAGRQGEPHPSCADPAGRSPSGCISVARTAFRARPASGGDTRGMAKRRGSGTIGRRIRLSAPGRRSGCAGAGRTPPS